MFLNRQVAKNAKGRSFALRGCRKAKTEPSISLLSKHQNVKDEAQSFFFDQNREEVLIKEVFLLPLPGKRKLIPALALFLGALRALAVPILQDHKSVYRKSQIYAEIREVVNSYPSPKK